MLAAQMVAATSSERRHEVVVAAHVKVDVVETQRSRTWRLLHSTRRRPHVCCQVYLDNDLQEKITGKIDSSFKPLAADVAAVKNDLAAVSASLTEIKSGVSSLKTSTAFVSYNFAALDVLVVAGLVIALYMINQENKKLSEELAGFNKKKR